MKKNIQKKLQFNKKIRHLGSLLDNKKNEELVEEVKIDNNKSMFKIEDLRSKLNSIKLQKNQEAKGEKGKRKEIFKA